MKKWVITALFALFMMSLITGCQVGISRNQDGSLQIQAEIPEAALESEIRTAIADPLVQDVSVDLGTGYLLAEATRNRLSGSGQDVMTFRLDLGVNEGHMTAVISEVVFDGFSVDQDRVELWNTRIANNLERSGNRSGDSELVEVRVTEQAVTLVWQVETARSRGQ